MELEEIDAQINQESHNFTNSFVLTYQKIREELFAFRAEILLASEKYTMIEKIEHQPD